MGRRAAAVSTWQTELCLGRYTWVWRFWCPQQSPASLEDRTRPDLIQAVPGHEAGPAPQCVASFESRDCGREEPRDLHKPGPQPRRVALGRILFC
jgi:hypothetical protein